MPPHSELSQVLLAPLRPADMKTARTFASRPCPNYMPPATWLVDDSRRHRFMPIAIAPCLTASKIRGGYLLPVPAQCAVLACQTRSSILLAQPPSFTMPVMTFTTVDSGRRNRYTFSFGVPAGLRSVTILAWLVQTSELPSHLGHHQQVTRHIQRKVCSTVLHKSSTTSSSS